MRILDVIECLSLGGAARSAIAAAKYCRRIHPLQHRMLSLLPPDIRAVELAREAGITVLHDLNDADAEGEIRRADIVQVHFWNNPAIHAFLQRPMPSVRLLTWCHVSGLSAPQVIPGALLDYGDVFLAASSKTLALTSVRQFARQQPAHRLAVIPAFMDEERLSVVRRRGSDEFCVGYVGTVDFVKMHPRYAEMHRLPEIPNLKVIVCGAGAARKTLERQVREFGMEKHFEFTGYREDIGNILSRIDVFGYPLDPDNYSTGELVLQEAMSAGIPPVVLPHGGAAERVDHQVNGLIATGVEDYRNSVLSLYRQPERRRELGRAAKKRASDSFGGGVLAPELLRIYGGVMARPPRSRPGLDLSGEIRIQGKLDSPGALRFMQSIGSACRDFRTSMESDSITEMLNAEARIAKAGHGMASIAGGGILHYSGYYPEDRFLHLWAGLVLEGAGRNALALAEYRKAMEKGFTHWRVTGYSVRAAANAGARDLQRRFEQELLRQAPDKADYFQHPVRVDVD